MFELEDVVDLAGFVRATPIRNAFFPLSPVTADQLEAYARGPIQELPRRLVLVKEDRRDIAYLRVTQQFWTPHPDLFAATISYLREADPHLRARQVIPVVESIAKQLGASKLSTWVTGASPELADELARAGYESGQINPISAADLSNFDSAPFEQSIARAEQAGYEFVDGAELQRRNPDDFMRQLYRYDMDAMADVPLPEPFQEVPFDVFVHDMHAPGQDFSLKLFALRDGEIAAGTGIMRNLVNPSLGDTGLTATMRGHRRQGLATAVKVLSMQRAKSLGIQTLMTDNEENNPMLELNVALGFRRIMDMTEFSRQIA